MTRKTVNVGVRLEDGRASDGVIQNVERNTVLVCVKVIWRWGLSSEDKEL